jgi:hypothetical protein
VSSGGPTQWKGCSLYPAAIARFIDCLRTGVGR